MEYFIDAVDVLDYDPVVPGQAMLELLKIHHPSCPISGKILLNIEDGYTITKQACPKKNGFMFTFQKEDSK